MCREKREWKIVKSAYLERWANTLGKYRYALLIAAVGVVLLAWPGGSRDEVKAEPVPIAETVDAAVLEEELAALLAQADGVGRVRVLLTRVSDGETVYAAETSRSYDRDNGDTTSVEESARYPALRSADGDETFAVQRQTYPTYRGAVVVCDGADDPGVRLKVINAVCALTGLSSNCVTVMKMK